MRRRRLKTQRKAASRTFGVAAGQTGVTVLGAHQARGTASRASTHGSSSPCDRDVPARVFFGSGFRSKPDGDQMTFDNFADGREQRRDIVSAHPLTAARIEYSLQLLNHEADVPAAAEQ